MNKVYVVFASLMALFILSACDSATNVDLPEPQNATEIPLGESAEQVYDKFQQAVARKDWSEVYDRVSRQTQAQLRLGIFIMAKHDIINVNDTVIPKERRARDQWIYDHPRKALAIASEKTEHFNKLFTTANYQLLKKTDRGDFIVLRYEYDDPASDEKKTRVVRMVEVEGRWRVDINITAVNG